jgi:hypothetical protein
MFAIILVNIPPNSLSTEKLTAPSRFALHPRAKKINLNLASGVYPVRLRLIAIGGQQAPYFNATPKGALSACQELSTGSRYEQASHKH